MSICGDDDADYADCGHEFGCDNCSDDDVDNNDDDGVYDYQRRRENLFGETIL